ncbi:hypothetical protein ANAPH1_01010 [Anaplasma phagocytophilum]|nr:hypothetical protein ANAPH1_01010 [Anaplasma phagocytophilum]
MVAFHLAHIYLMTYSNRSMFLMLRVRLLTEMQILVEQMYMREEDIYLEHS